MRLQISRKTGLALRALVVLAAHNGGTVAGRELAADLDTTTHFLPQVMKPLVDLDYVSSSPGPTGGYRLIADPAETTLLEVIEAIEGPFDLGRCIQTGKPCPTQETCALHVPWTRAKNAVLAELGAVTLDVLEPGSETEG